MSTREPLRVGLMLGGLEAEAWVDDVIRRIGDLPFAQLTLVLVDGTPPPSGSKYWRLRRNLLYYAYEKLDRRVFARRDPFRVVDLRPRLAGVEQLTVAPETLRHEQRFSAGDVATIRSYDLDVLVRFGFRVIRGEILECARHGVWSYHHGDNRAFRGGPPHFWEMLTGTPTTGAILQVLTDELDAGKVIYRSTTATDLVSLQRGRERSFWKAAAFVPRCLGEVHRTGRVTAEQPATSGRIYRLPTNAQMLRFLALTGRRLAAAPLGRFRPLDWFVGYRGRREQEWRVLQSPSDRFYADPFVIEHDGAAYLFFEDYSYRNGSAIISYVRLDESGAGEPRPALVRDHHLSYPFVFAHGGEHYLLPEGVESGRVELYRATRFPDKWELHSVLLDHPGGDPTLVAHDDRFWLFVNTIEPGAAYEDELSVFHAESLEGPWTPHARNPIVSDVRGARGAGRIFERDGMLIRPGQDAATESLGVLLHAIDRLTPDDYAEHVIERIGPDWAPGAVGAHTYNESKEWMAVDAYRRPFKLRWTRRVR